jgi:hypothetical protein
MLQDVDYDFQIFATYGKGGGVQLRTVPVLNEFDKLFEPGKKYRLEVQVVGAAARSKPFPIRLTWNGAWDGVKIEPLPLGE